MESCCRRAVAAAERLWATNSDWLDRLVRIHRFLLLLLLFFFLLLLLACFFFFFSFFFLSFFLEGSGVDDSSSGRGTILCIPPSGGDGEVEIRLDRWWLARQEGGIAGRLLFMDERVTTSATLSIVWNRAILKRKKKSFFFFFFFSFFWRRRQFGDFQSHLRAHPPRRGAVRGPEVISAPPPLLSHSWHNFKGHSCKSEGHCPPAAPRKSLIW